MMRIITILCLMMLTSQTQIAQAQLNLNNRNPLPSTRLLDRYGLEMDWWGQATIERGRDKIKHVTIDERNVITLSSSGLVTAFDAESGEKMWVSRLGRRDQASFKPVINNRQVLIVQGLRLYALDRLKGGIQWEIAIPQMPSTAPTADDNQIYIGTLDGSVYAFDLRTIEQLYRERLLPEYSLSTRVWRYKAGEKISSPPISHGRAISFASLDQSLYTVGKNTRDLIYQFETDAPVSAPLVINRRSLYLASEDFNFYCLNAENGQVRWSFLSGLPIRRRPYVIDGYLNGERTPIVYVLPDGAGIIAISATNGLPIWNQPQSQAVHFLAATERYLFVTDQIGDVLILDRPTGDIVGRLPANEFEVDTANDLTNRLFLCREDGLILMIRQQDATFPRYYQYPDRRPISPEIFDPEKHAQAEAETTEETEDTSTDQN